MAHNPLDTAITWRSVLSVALIWAAEYAMLTLIEDAPVALKVATMLSATAGLAVLQMEAWFRSRGAQFFYGAAFLVGVVWLCFVGYALNEIWKRDEIKATLRSIYSEGSQLAERPTPTGGGDGDRFQADYESWERTSAEWIRAHMGEAARALFVNHPTPTMLNINMGRVPSIAWMPCPNRDYNCQRTRLEENRKNLLSLIEGKFYE